MGRRPDINTHKSERGIWRLIKHRCYNATNIGYSNYGGRGIIMCDRWLSSFEQFYEDMGPRPSDKHSIDRIDNNGNYCKENCKWSTKREQANNKRTNRIIEFNNKSQTMTQWAIELDMTTAMIHNRIQNGWSIEKTLTTIPKRRNRKSKNE